MAEFETELQAIQKTFKKQVVQVNQPKTEFPELVVTVPDSWKQIQLAPLYDVHIGSPQHDGKLLASASDDCYGKNLNEPISFYSISTLRCNHSGIYF